MTTTPSAKRNRTLIEVAGVRSAIRAVNATRFLSARSQAQARLQLEMGRPVNFEETIIVALERMGEVSANRVTANPRLLD